MVVSIVIPNWNGEKLIGNCLDSIDRIERGKDFELEVIVVDNNSSDNSSEIIKMHHPEVKYIQLNSNTGFAHAVNVGITNSVGQYVCLLNNDTEVDKYWLVNLIGSLSLDTQIGIVTSKLINFFDRSKIDSAGDVMNIAGQAKSRGFGANANMFSTPEYVFSATGGASLYKREVFEKVGLFEEVYYMYFEDADFCYRAQKLNIKVYYQANAIVYHMHRHSSNKRSNLLDYWLYRNYAIFYLTNTPTLLFYRRLSLIKFILVFIHTAVYLSLQGKSLQAFKTWIWLLAHVMLIYRLRRKRNKNIEVSIDYIDSLRESKSLKVLGFTI